jgi:hypothetical protein
MGGSRPASLIFDIHPAVLFLAKTMASRANMSSVAKRSKIVIA